MVVNGVPVGPARLRPASVSTESLSVDQNCEMKTENLRVLLEKVVAHGAAAHAQPSDAADHFARAFARCFAVADRER